MEGAAGAPPLLPPEGNPAWMQEMGSVFVAGAMHAEGMVEKAMGASQEVLKWVREGGYTIKVSDEGRGIFKRNGYAMVRQRGCTTQNW